MGTRFRRSFKVAPGVRVNLNKKSASISFGPKGLKHTVSTTGKSHTTVGIPGTGLSYTTSSGGFLSTPSARRATAKTETKSLFSYKLYNILHEFRRALIYNGSKNYPNHAK